MKVVDLIKILEKMDKDALVVRKSSSYSWECYEKLELELAEKKLFKNGRIYEQASSTTEDEPKRREQKVVILL